ncbi:MAG: HlyD family efflux transporter periplasmic adaptor subunit [Marinilabiliaceae bacterium]|nr:HlyD family efflux transporter periplasmic adaptor subunit [Marinilabiliaceae bacterium]
MKKHLFPAEISEYTAESNFTSHNKSFRWIYVGLVVIIILFLVAIPLVSLDISTQSRGFIRTPQESTHIQSSIYGQVIQTHLREGMSVIKGDTLLQLRTDQLDEKIILKNKICADNVTFIADLTQLASGSGIIQTPKYQLEGRQYEAKVNEMEVSLKLLKREFHLAEKLFHEQVTPEMEYLQKKNKYEAAVSQLTFFKQQSQSTWQAEKTRLELANKDIQSVIAQLHQEKRQYVITAPVSGTLQQVEGVQSGSFITPGRKLAQISPDDELLVECYLSPSDIGYIRQGQAVRFQMDAFNYNHWGLIEGEVTQVSDDIVVLNDQPVFKVRCSLAQNFLELKSGQRGHLKKGMTLSARFFLTRRTLFQLLFDKMDDWLNPKIVNNE